MFRFAGWMVLAGCSRERTFDEVRELLDNPTAEVDADSMGMVADDFFRTQQVFAAENTSAELKGEASTTGTAGTVPSAQVNGLVGALFCVVDTAVSVRTFDDCSLGNTCTVRFDLNSCILRLDGDEEARGKIRFTVSSTEAADFDRASLELDFRNWRHTDGDLLFLGEGNIGLETTAFTNEPKVELIFTSDFDLRFQDLAQNDQYRQRLGAGARITAEDLTAGALYSVELVGWTDPDGRDNGEHVVVAYSLQKTWLSDAALALDFAMSVRGTNWDFTCTWSGDAVGIGGDAVTYTSNGTCTDEDGETFTWDNSLVVEG